MSGVLLIRVTVQSILLLGLNQAATVRVATAEVIPLKVTVK